MPRVDGEYQVPYPDVIPDTTIESVVHNGIVHDLVADANWPRPVTAGGTGAESPADARTNLQAEVREAVVTNYDSHVFEAGSFYSAAAATGAPAGGACTGLCTRNATTGDLFLQATDQTTGITYTRRRTGGAWSAWTATTAGLATIDYVNSVVSNTSLQALACNGMQINGDMSVCQEKPVGTGTFISSPSQYICDGWKARLNGAVAVAWYHGLNPTYFPGFLSNISSIVNTAKPSLAASDLVGIYLNIEGYRIAKLMWGTASALPITLGFWTRHTKIGTYTGIIGGSGANPSAKIYAFSYTQDVGSALEYKTIVIPGCQDAEWFADDRIGMRIGFTQACGASFIAPSLNNWMAGDYFAGPGQVNGIDSVVNSFRITGVVVLPGTQALTAAESSLLMRPYDQELVMCKRYSEMLLHLANSPFAAGLCVNATTAYASLAFSEKRAIPTISIPSAISAYKVINATGGMVNCTALAAADISNVNALLVANVASGLVAGDGAIIYGNTGTGVFLDARL